MKKAWRLVIEVLKLVPGLVWLKRRLVGQARKPENVPVSYPADRGAPPVVDSGALVEEYRRSPVSDESDQFVLYRIIGNDLVPRHSRGQSRENLRFILDNEPDLRDCEKRFVVNRIADPAEEQAIIDMLEEGEFAYIHLPFDDQAYRETCWDIHGVPAEFAPSSNRYRELREDRRGRVLGRLYRHRNNYAINNNGARNVALEDGRRRAKWVLPWDGNCFLTTAAWEEIRAAITARPEVPCHVVPMARITENRDLLKSDFRPTADEEPQILFRRDVELRFSPEYFYGRRPKVELFWRLGIPGKWDHWPIEPWDLPCPDYDRRAGAFGRAGWVARLFSGQARFEQSLGDRAMKQRGNARLEGIFGLLDALDERTRASELNSDRPIFASPEACRGSLPQPLSEKLSAAAEEALGRGPYSVLDKTTLPPGRNRHDYWHPAPYFWPHPLRLPGLPYVRRDGERVPGTRMYEPLSERYDRTRLQRVFDDTYVLTLALYHTGDERYGEHAARLVRTWFLDPATAMNPHLRYAQVRRGHNRDQGTAHGIIEMKDLYYFLDGVRLLTSAGYLYRDDNNRFREWLGQYLHWLRNSPQGHSERAARNNHGTYYDLQVASIAAFLGEYLIFRDTLRDSRFRIVDQFDGNGFQRHEMARTTTAHYCCFNLQGWIHLAELSESGGEDLWGFEGPGGESIRSAVEWLVPHIGRPWPYQQINDFDHDRFFPILYASQKKIGDLNGSRGRNVPRLEEVEPLFFPHDGIRPFWQIGL